MALLDWLIVAAYVIFALTVGVVYAKRAGRDVDQYFLSGRSLPWWLAGTSMVATSFAADTPLVITGWVRDYGIWKNWLWWCYCAGGMMGVFLFARWWRRGGVMTKAELAELRYGGAGAAALRGVLGFMHAGITNTITLCWVLLAAAKIMGVLFEIDQTAAVVVGCSIALIYSLMAGFWGVVVTDLVQFVMAMTGAAALAWLSWSAVGGSEGLRAAAEAGAPFSANTLEMFPRAGPGSFLDASFWTRPFAALFVYLGVAWWAVENVDGAGTAVQRIAASRDERQGVLGLLWFNVAHYALRPWAWILVALASLVVLPHASLEAPAAGRVIEVHEGAAARHIVLETDAGERRELDLETEVEGWDLVPAVEVGATVRAGDALASTDSERAYVVMMKRYLPVGLLGLVVASLLAAFMSTIDTHLNLAASFFVNDLYRRFLFTSGSPRHYVRVARLASVVVLVMAATMASFANSISELVLFFLAFLGGVGPVYVLRWLWWRVQPSTEITAMLSSALATTYLTLADIHWELGPFSLDGALSPEGRLCLVVLVSVGASLISLLVAKRPDPGRLVPFYELVRPAGWWGPVAELAPGVPRKPSFRPLWGILGGIALVYGGMLGIGYGLLGQGAAAGLALGVSLVGALVVAAVLKAEGRGAAA